MTGRPRPLTGALQRSGEPVPTTPPRDRSPAMAPARARVISRVLNWTAVFVGLWALRRPTPLVAVAAAFGISLLALAVAFLGRGAFQLLRDKADERPTLSIALFASAALASLPAVASYDLVAPVELLPAAFGIGVVLTALAAAGDRAVRARAWHLLALLPLMVGMSASALTHANCLEDASPVTEYEATVLDKRVGKGRRGPTRSLRLGPWGPRPGPSTVHVTRDMYESAGFGETVRIQLRPGRLGFGWFRVLPPGGASRESTR
jgi:hypothetical protein